MMPEITQQRDESGHDSSAGAKRSEAESPRLIARQSALIRGVGPLVVDIGLHQFNPCAAFVGFGEAHRLGDISWRKPYTAKSPDKFRGIVNSETLESYVLHIENLRHERKLLNEDIKEVHGEATDIGFAAIINRLKSAAYFSVPKVNDNATFFAGLRKARMPRSDHRH